MHVDNYDNINDTNIIIDNKKLNQFALIIFIHWMLLIEGIISTIVNIFKRKKS